MTDTKEKKPTSKTKIGVLVVFREIYYRYLGIRGIKCGVSLILLYSYYVTKVIYYKINIIDVALSNFILSVDTTKVSL